MSLPRRTLISVALLLLCRPAPAQHSADKSDPATMAEVSATGEAEAFIMLREPLPHDRRNVRARQLAIATLRDATLASVPAEDIRVHHQFSAVSGFTATVSAMGLARLLASDTVRRVDPVRYGAAALTQSVPQIRADTVQRRGDLGQGVTVAVLDVGVDPTHPDLAGSIVAEECFCSSHCCPNGEPTQSGPGSATTTTAHGTHVTGVIASRGNVGPVGVAPGAQIVAVKVLDDNNQGSLADWLAALDWIATSRPDVQVINMSLASKLVHPSTTCDDADSTTMAFAQVLGILRARGVLTFVAAGNSGQADALAAPACVGAAVAVGAVAKDDAVADFSDSDPALDLLAPGVDILASSSSGHLGGCTPSGTSTAICTGTSEAAPHAAGSAALMLAINPALGADQLESILKETGHPIFDDRNGLTVPRIDALAAMNAVLEVTRPLLGGGSARNDCLAEWNFAAPSGTSAHPFTAITCRDNDPACDTDSTPGQCTLQMTLCFNVPDRRLPGCTTDAPIIEYRLTSPSTTHPADTIDAANAAAISAALPALPVSESNRCTAPIAFAVPTGARWIRFTARAGDGRMDYDRLRLTCRE